jgi:hypothetical protein
VLAHEGMDPEFSGVSLPGEAGEPDYMEAPPDAAMSSCSAEGNPYNCPRGWSMTSISWRVTRDRSGTGAAGTAPLAAASDYS